MKAIVLEGPADKDGKTPFTMFWVGNGWRRAQCFKARLEDYLGPGAVVASGEAAKDLAGWPAAKARDWST